jgi:hypothetical protein
MRKKICEILRRSGNLIRTMNLLPKLRQGAAQHLKGNLLAG